MLNKLKSKYGYLISILSNILLSYYRYHDLYHVKLLIKKIGTPRYQPGSFHLPFGDIIYVDIESFESQYYEIFCEKCYSFNSDNQCPRIIDCGGNIGLAALWFKKEYPEASITVYEANSKLSKIIDQNIVKFGFKDIHVINAAVWNKDGYVNFKESRNDAGVISKNKQDATVKSINLSDQIAQPIDLLKMDIEGAEYDVLLDLCETGKISFIKRIICEFHGTANSSYRLGEILSALNSVGFHITTNHAKTQKELYGYLEPTPFPAVSDGKFLLHLYAWKDTSH